MTTRVWFRKLRAEAWTGSRPPHILIYFREETGEHGPLAPPVSLIDFHDYQTFLDKVDRGEGVPVHPLSVLRRFSFPMSADELTK